MPADLWAPYRPDAADPWDLRRVVHLHRRAGFAATWPELRRDLKDGPGASTDRLLNGDANAHTPADFADVSELLAGSAVAAGDIGRVRAWWVYRMLFGPDPLTERLTLMWHDHFATGFTKVRRPELMYRQNASFREHARGKFADLLNAAVRQPALLFYLDAPTNRKGHANENLARELMELFTLGVGHYTEADVKDAARALTGWTVESGNFVERAASHDGGPKTILGQSGDWGGEQLVNILLKRPAVADRIAYKLGREFFGEKALPAAALVSLADILRRNDLNIGHAAEVILKSRLFFADANIRSRVLSPVEFVVGAARALGMFDPAPSTLALAGWAAKIGQSLFDPPNVGGWPHGRDWLHARGLIARANYASALVGGPRVGRPTAYDPRMSVADHHLLLFGTGPTPAARKVTSVADLLASPAGQIG